MSCLILKSETVAAIADYIASLLNVGFDFHRMEAPRELAEAFKICTNERDEFSSEKIYNLLSALNRVAYFGRYRRTEDGNGDDLNTFPEYGSNIKYKPCAWGNGHAVVEPWHYEMLKRVQCLHYQLDEDATYNLAETKALSALAAKIACFIAMNSDEYAAAKWGE